MAQEIELKLALNIRDTPLLRQHPLLVKLPHRKYCLRNIYLDTPSQELKQHGIALRRRYTGDQWLLTIKTESLNISSTGLSHRMEWEYPMDPEQLDFSPIDSLQVRHILEQQVSRLLPAFRTDFVRTAWQISQGNSLIEAALDMGYIRIAKAREPLCELELELLQGQESELVSLAASLQKTLPLTPLSLSKAARGYSLMSKNPA